MMRIVFALAAFCLSATVLQAQYSLVYNGGFDQVEKKIKEGGAIEQTTEWYSPTADKADLYNQEAKEEAYAVPINHYGEAEAMNGSGYAGILVFSEKEAQPRQYLQTKLRESFDAGKVYCVKFHVRLSELSKHAANNIGAIVTTKKISSNEIEEYSIQPTIIHSQNKVYEEQFDWVAICKTIKAEGGERYLTIGNFANQDDMQTEKMKKPRDTPGQQQRHAYYYIDDVSVYNMAGIEECDCERDAGGKTLAVKYTKNVSTEMEIDASEEIGLTRIYFPHLANELDAQSQADIQKVASILKQNPDIVIEVTGHTDPLEEMKTTSDISKNRAIVVRDALIAAGVDSRQLKTVNKADSDTATEDATSAGQAKNRRVTFVILEEF